MFGGVAFNMVIQEPRFLLICHLANFSMYLQSHYRWGEKRVEKARLLGNDTHHPHSFSMSESLSHGTVLTVRGPGE